MENPLNKLEKLAARARQEKTPAVDVSQQVLYRLSQREASRSRPLLIFAIASFATALVVIALSFSLFETMTDPLWTLFQVLPISGQ